VAAPLRLTNQLPVPGSLLVWEQQAGSKDLVGRQTMQVPTGATVPIHTGVCCAAEGGRLPYCTFWQLVQSSISISLHAAPSLFNLLSVRLPTCLPVCLPPHS
jgi:hypothetical protein